MWMWWKKHNLDENFRYDESNHWKWCYDEECFKANKKFEEGEHTFVLNGEPEVIKMIGSKDHIKTLYKCDVCEYQKTDFTEDADGLIYGTFEYPATPSNMPDSYVSPNDKIKLEIISFPSTSQSYVCYVDVENDGYIYVKVAIAQDAITGGSWHIYNSDKELINVGAPYETYEKSFYQYKIRLYEIPVTKGRCYFKVTHDAATFQGAKSCYTIAISSNKFVKDLY